MRLSLSFFLSAKRAIAPSTLRCVAKDDRHVVQPQAVQLAGNRGAHCSRDVNSPASLTSDGVQTTTLPIGSLELESYEEWEQNLQQVSLFVQQNGRIPRRLPTSELPLASGERALAAWCSHQHKRKEGLSGCSLTTEQRLALEAIPGWRWITPRHSQVPWQVRYEQVQSFVQQHGRLPKHVPAKGMQLQPGEKPLGVWCLSQKSRWRGKGTCRPMIEQQRLALEAIPGWVWEERKTEEWATRCQQLRQFVQQYDRMPRKVALRQEPLEEGERELGDWCHNQRARRKGQGTCTPLTPDQIEALAAIPGWVWEDPRKEQYRRRWDRQLRRVEEFVRTHGRFPRRKSRRAGFTPLEPSEVELEAWCSRQRQRRDRLEYGWTPLSQEQVQALEALPGWKWERISGNKEKQ